MGEQLQGAPGVDHSQDGGKIAPHALLLHNQVANESARRCRQNRNNVSHRKRRARPAGGGHIRRKDKGSSSSQRTRVRARIQYGDHTVPLKKASAASHILALSLELSIPLHAAKEGTGSEHRNALHGNIVGKAGGGGAPQSGCKR
jgi:hypothetical protein